MDRPGAQSHGRIMFRPFGRANAVENVTAPSLRTPLWLGLFHPAIYFITICTYRRDNLFTGSVRDIVANAWQAIPGHPAAQHVCLDQWVVMPNHLHGLLSLTDVRVELRLNGLDINEMPFPLASFYRSATVDAGCEARLIPGSLGAVIGSFKSIVARRVNNIRRTPGSPVWQRGYYERIVRDARELEAVRRYIEDNPRRWAEDRDNLDLLLSRLHHAP
jgi:REP element-mobilizing transposase RayT